MPSGVRLTTARSTTPKISRKRHLPICRPQQVPPRKPVENAYFSRMRSFEFCLPTKGTTLPDGPDWLHEVKYDGYRLRLERDGDRVRLITRGGYNWTGRYPWIVEAARKIRQKHFVLDGEAVVLGLDGISDFNALHSRKHDHEVQFCASGAASPRRRTSTFTDGPSSRSHRPARANGYE